MAFKKKKKQRNNTSKINRFSHWIGMFILFVVVISVVLILKSSIQKYDFGNNIIDIHTPLFSFLNPKQEKDIEEENNQHINVTVKEEGEVLYEPIKAGYRYGPSLLLNEDGTIHAYFASNANNKEWDWITYRFFDGEEWSNEQIVLQPTGYSLDQHSTCDPGVIYFNGYYYLGYTSSTSNEEEGVDNDIFVARSTSPTGPFEKWNGNGWSGDPYPFIDYDGEEGYWGAGEVSFVIVNDALYCYYSYISEEGATTKLAIADLSENWPDTLKEMGDVLERGYGQDSFDVAYLEKEEMFVAFTTYNRFSYDSGIAVYQSKDGIHFYFADRFAKDVAMYCHNMGISKRANGHIQEEDPIYIGYAYGENTSSWGRWAFRIQEVEIDLETGNLYHEDETPKKYAFENNISNDNMIGINIDPRYYCLSVGQKIKPKIYLYDGNLRRSLLTSNVEYLYDEEIITLTKNGSLQAISKGETNITVFYDDFYTTFKIIVD